MRDPLNIIKVDYNKPGFEVLTIDDLPEYGISDYDLMDDKDRNKYFDSIEKLVRGSFEYRQFTKYLRENCDMNKCSIYENVNNIDSFKIKIHIHHHPFTLYDIVTIVYNKRCAYQESLAEELVAKEVLFLHYNLYVGLIPLAETVHELVHNNYLFIPLNRVFGAFKEFANMYIDFIPVEVLDLLDRNIEFTERFNEDSEFANMHILNKNYVYVDLTGSFDKPDYDVVTKMLYERIKEVKSGNEKQLVNGIEFY
jgi:hypothetical protein